MTLNHLQHYHIPVINNSTVQCRRMLVNDLVHHSRSCFACDGSASSSQVCCWGHGSMGGGLLPSLRAGHLQECPCVHRGGPVLPIREWRVGREIWWKTQSRPSWASAPAQCLSCASTISASSRGRRAGPRLLWGQSTLLCIWKLI